MGEKEKDRERWRDSGGGERQRGEEGKEGKGGKGREC